MDGLCFILLGGNEVERCYVDFEFQRHCGTALQQEYGLTSEHCRQLCNDDERCGMAQWHPGGQIWDDEPRSTCFTFQPGVNKCEWGGKETGEHHPGAQLFRCSKFYDPM